MNKEISKSKSKDRVESKNRYLDKIKERFSSSRSAKKEPVIKKVKPIIGVEREVLKNKRKSVYETVFKYVDFDKDESDENITNSRSNKLNTQHSKSRDSSSTFKTARNSIDKLPYKYLKITPRWKEKTKSKQDCKNPPRRDIWKEIYNSWQGVTDKFPIKTKHLTSKRYKKSNTRTNSELTTPMK